MLEQILRFRHRLAAPLILAFVAAGLAYWSAPASAKRDRTRFRLRPTNAGAALGLKGNAKTDVRVGRGREKISAEVQSTVLASGSTIQIWVKNPTNSPNFVMLGVITLLPGRPGRVEGEVEFKNFDGGSIPAGVSPVADVTEFEGRDPNTGDVLLVSVARGGGGGGGNARLRREVLLTPPAPKRARAKGRARTDTRPPRSRESFAVEVEFKDLAVGDVVDVSFTNPTNGAGEFSAGSLTLIASPTDPGEVGAEIEFKNWKNPPLPANASPVKDIMTVNIRKGGVLLLTGTF